MEVSISARHGSITEEANDLIRQKAAKLPRFYERVTQVEVVIDLQHSEPEVEMKVCAEHHDDFFAKAHGNNVLSAVESVLQKIEQQLKKYKEKITSHHRGSISTAGSEV